MRANPGRDKDVERALYAVLRRHDGAAIARKMGIAYSKASVNVGESAA